MRTKICNFLFIVIDHSSVNLLFLIKKMYVVNLKKNNCIEIKFLTNTISKNYLFHFYNVFFTVSIRNRISKSHRHVH